MSRQHRANMFKVSLASAALLVLAATTAAAEPSFSFHTVEYLPLEQREAAAKAFLADKAQAGTSMQAAVQALRTAGAHCSAPRAGSAVVPCMSSSLERDPGGDMSDITWRIDLTPSSQDTVASAAVTRTRAGL
ncbi:MAG: hypothetical protein WA840_20060 [Caulobacteraceae bacterium]